MFFLAYHTSGAGSLAPGESYKAAWPGHDNERYGSIEAAQARAGKDYVVLHATMTTERNSIGEPLWLITKPLARS